jgi:phenol hydroxylase P0 protein
MSQVNANHRWVRVLRETGNDFIEFEFFVADTDLYVELILPKAAFREFCTINQVRFLDQDGADTAPPTSVLRRIK